LPTITSLDFFIVPPKAVRQKQKGVRTQRGPRAGAAWGRHRPAGLVRHCTAPACGLQWPR